MRFGTRLGLCRFGGGCGIRLVLFPRGSGLSSLLRSVSELSLTNYLVSDWMLTSVEIKPPRFVVISKKKLPGPLEAQSQDSDLHLAEEIFHRIKHTNHTTLIIAAIFE